METTQKNFNWKTLREVQLGDEGEQIVKKNLEKLGFVLYAPETDASHEIDKIAFFDRIPRFLVEVKTKPMMKKYLETGFNASLYSRYVAVSKKLGLPLLIAFVDCSAKMIYGNFISVLSEPTLQYNPPTNEFIQYPKKLPTKYDKKNCYVIYFPKCLMIDLFTLTESEVNKLKNLSLKGYSDD